jgi:hypothetical protein
MFACAKKGHVGGVRFLIFSPSAPGASHLLYLNAARLHDIHLYLFAQIPLIQSGRVVLFSCVCFVLHRRI